MAELLDKAFWYKVGPGVVAQFKKHTFMEAKDIDDNPFKGYSQEYGEAKRNNELPRQATEFAKSKAPVLTSDLMNDFKMMVDPHKNGFSFGTAAHGGKVASLARMGRVITTYSKPVPKHIEKYLQKKMDKYVQKGFDSQKDQTIKIKLPKK